MRSSTCYLPNGQTFTVTPVFGGVTFKSNDMNLHHSALPPGWTVIIQTNKNPLYSVEHGPDMKSAPDDAPNFTRFTTPTLRDDSLYISYIVNPPSSDFKPASSPSRLIAMMLWTTLLWYFHEPEPDLHRSTSASAKTPLSGKPKGNWRVYIRREGIFKGRNILPKLERMGLIASEDSSVIGPELAGTRDSSTLTTMFVSRQSFWQIDPRIFLFTLTPKGMPPSPSLSPFPSRAVSPSPSSSREGFRSTDNAHIHSGDHGSFDAFAGPFWSGSHLPTFYPPPPTQYIFTNGVRHPIRPKPPHQGETFYIRYIPSVQQYLSFRTAYLPQPSSAPISTTATATSGHSHSTSTSSIEFRQPTPVLSDIEMLHKWMNDPCASAAWGVTGEPSVQEQFLRDNLASRHSFPVIGCWDGKPFGYFEIYWVKEDSLGQLLGGNVEDYDRGIRLLVGEQEFRGSHRVTIWLSALVHYCWLADMRTRTVLLEPRVDNEKMINYFQQSGFYKEGEASFPHKQSAVMKIKREFWEAPAL